MIYQRFAKSLLPLVLMVPAAAAATPGATLDRARAEMIIDPSRVVALVRQARAELTAQASGDATVLHARADWLESEALGRLGRLKEAERLAARALAVASRVQPGSKLVGDILSTQGAIALDQNRMKRAFELFRRSYDLFNKLGDTRAQAIALQNIGTIYSFAGDQRSVLRYYAQAAEVHPNDATLAQAAANNLGTAYRELGDFKRADADYRRALTLARELKSPLLEARVLNNLASVALLRGRLDEADRFAARGLGVAATTDAAEWAPFLWGVKAQVALARGQVATATALFDRVFADTDLATTSFYFRDFHQSASEAYQKAGNAPLALRHLQAFKRLDDEAREIRSSTNSALAAAQFDFSNQELKIVRLREGQLARDVAIARARARQQLLMLSASLLLLAVSVAAFFWIRRSRNETRVANRQLETTNVALDKALRAKSEFLATTSHEIRTPLNGILGMTQVLMQRRSLDSEARDQVRLIDSAGNTMKAIVDDILDMAQIEQGRVEVDRTTVDLPDLVDGIAGLWRGAAERKGVAVLVDLSDAPALIEEDERKLRQIGFNLMSNAVKFTLEGCVTLRVATSGEFGDERLILSVADTGIGIAADQRDAIFEPFRQADGSTARQFGGTGLGLAISVKLAEALGGTIDLTSCPGVGSTFTLTLPLRRVAAGECAAAATVARSLGDATVVVVEPNLLFASMVEACLGTAKQVVLVDTVDATPAQADVVLLGDAPDPATIAAARTAAPRARLVVFGATDMPAAVDGVVERTMPPLHLAASLDTLLAAPPNHLRIAA